MPREMYHDKIIDFIKEQGRPVTIAEIQEAVGMTRASAYQWRDRNQDILVPAGRGRNKGLAYTLAEQGATVPQAAHQAHPHGRGVAVATVDGDGAGPDGAPDLQLGANYKVTGLSLDDEGRTVVTMQNEGGDVLRVIV